MAALRDVVVNCASLSPVSSVVMMFPPVSVTASLNVKVISAVSATPKTSVAGTDVIPVNTGSVVSIDNIFPLAVPVVLLPTLSLITAVYVMVKSSSKPVRASTWVDVNVIFLFAFTERMFAGSPIFSKLLAPTRA